MDYCVDEVKDALNRAAIRLITEMTYGPFSSWIDPPFRLAVELADVTASVRTRFCLAARPKKPQYLRLLGIHLGDPGRARPGSNDG